MDWLTLAQIIAREGIDVGEAIFTRWSSGQLPTAEDFVVLKALGQKTPADLVHQAATLAGLDPGNEKVQQLLELVKTIPTPVSPPTPPSPS